MVAETARYRLFPPDTTTKAESFMVPLDAAAARYVRTWLGPPPGPGLLALRHALVYRRPGLWGDHPSAPQSVLLVREGEGRLEVFGAGAAEPAVGWLAAQVRPFTLLSPDDWHEVVSDRLGGAEIETDGAETWSGGLIAPIGRVETSSKSKSTSSQSSFIVSTGPKAASPTQVNKAGVTTRRLTASDFAAFTAGVPAWALRGWRSFPALIEYGAAFGVPHGSGFASIAWVFDQVDGYDSVGVFTTPRYRRLGLGRASSSALIEHIVLRRGKIPLWSTTPANTPSRTLARTLRFAVAGTETLLHWPPTTARTVIETD